MFTNPKPGQAKADRSDTENDRLARKANFRAFIVVCLFHQKNSIYCNAERSCYRMDTKKLIPVISIVSVGVMVVWGMLANDWSKSWLAVFAGGIIIAVISSLNKK